MTAAIELDAYFRRIRWSGGRDPTLETLAGIIAAHTAQIPFENLDVLLGRGVRLDLDGLQAKIVGAGRGGYCFEQASLLAAVLEALGYRVARHSGRVVLFGPLAQANRTHMFLTVAFGEATYVVDPGFGPFAARFPVPLVDTPPGRATHWMQHEGAHWVHYVTREDRQPVAGWASTLEAENPSDFEVYNHYVATYPTSAFVNWVFLSAATPEGRLNVMNRDVTMLKDASEPTRWQLADRAALRELLRRHFGFDLPEVEHLSVPAVPEWS